MKVLSALGAMGIAAASVFGVESPVSVDADRSDAVMTALTLEADVMETLRFEDRFVMEAFPLDVVTSVDLQLERRDPLRDTVIMLASGDQEFPIAAPDMHAFGGTVAGDEDSLVFLAFSDYGLEGIIELDNETWVISRGEREGDPVAIYNLTTLPEGVINWAEFICHADAIDQPMVDVEATRAVTSRGDECRKIELAVETDVEYLGLFGNDELEASVYIGTLIGAISEVYHRDLYTFVDMVYLRLWDSQDPWNGGDTVDELLAVGGFWEANMGHIARDAVHFVSGRGLGGGVAWLPGTCNGPYAYAVSANIEGNFPFPRRDNDARNWDFMVIAHELGHNCGAPHTHEQTPRVDNCAGQDCTITPDGTIMSYCHLCPGGMTNVRLQFHPQTIESHMLPYLRGLSCDVECEVGLRVTYPGGTPTEIISDQETEVTVFVTGTLTHALPETATLHYNTGDGWTTAPIEHTEGMVYNAVLPPVECGGAIDYYVRVQGDNGQWYRAPKAGEFVHAISAIDYRDVFRANFEADAGFTAEHVDMVDGEWQRVVPTTRGIRFTPDEDYDGSGTCWVTDDETGNSDVDGGPAILTSPEYDVRGYFEPVVTFAYWFGNHNYDEDTFVIEVSKNGGDSWEMVRTITGNELDPSADFAWTRINFRIQEYVPRTARFRVRVSVTDNPNNSVTEAAIDDFRIRETRCTDCQADWNADGSLNIFDIIDFLDSFSTGLAGADVNEDGEFNIFDITDYLAIFDGGC